MPLKEQAIPVQEAAQVAPKKTQQDIINEIYADLAAKKAKKEQAYAEAMERRAAEELVLGDKVRNPWAVYVNIDEAVERAYAKMEEDEPTEQDYQDPDYLVKTEFTDQGEVVTIPNIARSLPDDWEEALFSYEEPDEIVQVSRDRLAVARGGQHLRLGVRKMNNGLFVEMVDTVEGELTQRRLHGRLLHGTDPELGERMGYLPDDAKFIHPSVQLQTEQSLRDMLKVVHLGAIIDSK